MNKAFKVSRIQGVEIFDTEWEYAIYHRLMFTDVLMFSGEGYCLLSCILASCNTMY